MLERWKQKTLQCNKCRNQLAELDLDGPRQNVCPHCQSVNSCEPIEDVDSICNKNDN